MAINEFAVCLHNASGLPRDDSVNVLYFDVTAPDTHEGVADDIAAAYVTLSPHINSAFQTMTIKVYDPGQGPPKLSKNYFFQPLGDAGPTEVALCLSYKSDDPGNPKRRRGRIYLPFKNNVSVRPQAGQVTALLDFGDLLDDVGTFANTGWKLKSRIGNGTPLNPAPTYHDINSISVDNEWDTQRRRGMRATARTTRNT